MIETKIICDSVNTAGERLTTYLLVYPRIIHAELLTHRLFSRNSSSSRAIPVAKMIAAVENNLFVPQWWGKNERGMSASVELEGDDRQAAIQVWLKLARQAIAGARELAALNVHKQLANRPLEPYSYITTILSGTEFQNFFAQRTAPDAQPELRDLAGAMLGEMRSSKPKLLQCGDSHLPFGEKMPDEVSSEDMFRIAVARCARLSYLTHDGCFAPEKDFELHDRLIREAHMSPLEHCATASPGERSGNFVGFRQYRKSLPCSDVRSFPL